MKTDTLLPSIARRIVVETNSPTRSSRIRWWGGISTSPPTS
jgi:hypothetical protein